MIPVQLNKATLLMALMFVLMAVSQAWYIWIPLFKTKTYHKRHHGGHHGHHGGFGGGGFGGGFGGFGGHGEKKHKKCCWFKHFGKKHHGWGGHRG